MKVRAAVLAMGVVLGLASQAASGKAAPAAPPAPNDGVSLRLAIEHLIKTQGSAYPEGSEYLERLPTLEKASDPSVLRVARGGSWYDRSFRCTSSFRFAYPQWQGVYNVGFRVVGPAE